MILKKAAEEALTQIETGEYLAEAKQRGIKNILKIGIAFSGKYFSMSYCKVDCRESNHGG